jgi:hypothetical protein
LDIESTRSDPHKVEVANVRFFWVIVREWVLVGVQTWWRDVFEVRHILVVLIAVMTKHVAVPRIIVVFDLDDVSVCPSIQPHL